MKRQCTASIVLVGMVLCCRSGGAQSASWKPDADRQNQLRHLAKATDVSPGTYPSPDGKFKLVMTKPRELSEIPYETFQVVPATMPARRRTWAGFIRAKGEQVHMEKCIWLPRHPHSLVVLRKASVGASSLVLWTGGTGSRVLFKGRTLDSEDGDAEFLDLHGASQDGSRVYYSYLKFTVDKNGDVKEKADPQKLPLKAIAVSK